MAKPTDPEAKKNDAAEEPEKAVKKAKKGKIDEKDELSEEDQILKDNLDLMVTRTKDNEPGIQANAIQVGSSPCLGHPPPAASGTRSHALADAQACFTDERVLHLCEHSSTGDRHGDQECDDVDDFGAEATQIPSAALCGAEGDLRGHADGGQPVSARGRAVGAGHELGGGGRPGGPQLPAGRHPRHCQLLGPRVHQVHIRIVRLCAVTHMARQRPEVRAQQTSMRMPDGRLAKAS